MNTTETSTLAVNNGHTASDSPPTAITPDMSAPPHTENTQHQSLIPKNALKEFQVGVTYRFGAIEPDDEKKGNYHSPNFGGKGATVKDGAWFIANGYRTILDFERNGKQENGKPYPHNKTFVMQMLEKPDLIATTIHIWTFEKRHEPKAQETPNFTTSPLQRTTPKKTARHEAVLGDHIGEIFKSVAENANQTSMTLQGQINALTTENNRLRHENSQLRVDNDTLRAQNFTNTSEITRLKSSFDERVTAIQAAADERVKAIETSHDYKLNMETERLKLEEQVERANAIKVAIAEAREQWDEEREEEEETLQDEIEKETKQNFAEEYRKLEKEWEKLEKAQEKWEEKKGVMEKSAEALSGLLVTPAGQSMFENGMTVIAGLLDQFVTTKYPKQKENLAAQKQIAAEIQQQQKAAQQAQQAAQTPNPNIYPMNGQNAAQNAANDDEWVRTSTED